jgi:hypothetical protein
LRVEPYSTPNECKYKDEYERKIDLLGDIHVTYMTAHY